MLAGRAIFFCIEANVLTNLTGLILAIDSADGQGWQVMPMSAARFAARFAACDNLHRCSGCRSTTLIAD